MDLNKAPRQLKVLCPGDSVVDFKHSIFLAGPTPRSQDVESWRPQALKELRMTCFKGTVLVPERSDWITNFNYMEQIEWELKGLSLCTVIAFWIPRNMVNMQGLTTNIEFGRYVDSGRAIYGRPEDAEHIAYLDYIYGKVTGKRPYPFLSLLMDAVAKEAFNG